MDILIYGIYIYLLMGLTWMLYLAIMNLAYNRGKITLPAKIFGVPWFFLGLLLDFLLNTFIGTIDFRELPKWKFPNFLEGETLFSGRVSRHKKESTGRKQIRAIWWCENFLDPFDFKGPHCK